MNYFIVCIIQILILYCKIQNKNKKNIYLKLKKLVNRRSESWLAIKLLSGVYGMLKIF